VRPLGKPLLALPAIAAIVLVPWTVGLATQLPHRSVAYHWNTAWTGLDAVIAIGLALTSWLSHRHDARGALTATATTVLMCADAWFDLCTSAPGRRSLTPPPRRSRTRVRRRVSGHRLPHPPGSAWRGCRGDRLGSGENAGGQRALPLSKPGDGPV